MTPTELVFKHFPRFEAHKNKLAIKLAEIAELAKLEEQDIKELCELLSDEFDDSFQSGIDAERSCNW